MPKKKWGKQRDDEGRKAIRRMQILPPLMVHQREKDNPQIRICMPALRRQTVCREKQGGQEKMKRSERLTAKRCNGIKDGYWSSHTKAELVDRLAAYEDTGLTPEEIRFLLDQMKAGTGKEVTA